MTFVSLAEACRRLGIDAKTLPRWLADAQLPLQSYPHDGRKKPVTPAHPHALTPLQPPPPPGVCPRLAAALVARSEARGILQAQIAAWQQQGAALPRLLHQQGPEPAMPLAPTQQTRTAKRPPRPTSPAPRSRPVAKPP